MIGERVLFVHVPRTGGQAIRAALGLHDPEIHLTAAEQWRRLGAEVLERYRFTVIRNPWDRLVSIFAFLHRARPETITPPIFRSWAHSGLLDPSGRAPVLYADTDFEIRVTAPQADWHGALAMDQVLRFERLEQDFGALCERLGIEARLDRRNGVARTVPPAAFYDVSTANLVRRWYWADVELTGAEGPSE